MAYMEKCGVVMSEMSYTALARVRAANGDVDGALEWVRRMKSETPRQGSGRTRRCCAAASAEWRFEEDGERRGVAS